MKAMRLFSVCLAALGVGVWLHSSDGCSKHQNQLISGAAHALESELSESRGAPTKPIGSVASPGLLQDKPSATAGHRASPASWAELSSHPRRKPPLEAVLDFSEADLPELLSRYAGVTNLLDRRALIWVLAYVGGDDVQGVFEHTLLHDGAGRQFGSSTVEDEEWILLDLPYMMGLVAQTSDRAYDFIKSGTDPLVWRERVNWSSPRYLDSVAILTGRSIQALGLSGRPGTRALLEEIKARAFIQDPASAGLERNLMGEVVDGVFKCEFVGLFGVPELRRQLLTPDALNESYDKWIQTSSGRAWRKWFRESQGLPLQDSPGVTID